jgi:hypothetical protein
VTAKLQVEGVASFAKSFTDLMSAIDSKRQKIGAKA